MICASWQSGEGPAWQWLHKLCLFYATIIHRSNGVRGDAATDAVRAEAKELVQDLLEAAVHALGATLAAPAGHQLSISMQGVCN